MLELKVLLQLRGIANAQNSVLESPTCSTFHHACAEKTSFVYSDNLLCVLNLETLEVRIKTLLREISSELLGFLSRPVVPTSVSLTVLDRVLRNDVGADFREELRQIAETLAARALHGVYLVTLSKTSAAFSNGNLLRRVITDFLCLWKGELPSEAAIESALVESNGRLSFAVEVAKPCGSSEVSPCPSLDEVVSEALRGLLSNHTADCLLSCLFTIFSDLKRTHAGFTSGSHTTCLPGVSPGRRVASSSMVGSCIPTLSELLARCPATILDRATVSKTLAGDRGYVSVDAIVDFSKFKALLSRRNTARSSASKRARSEEQKGEASSEIQLGVPRNQPAGLPFTNTLFLPAKSSSQPLGGQQSSILKGLSPLTRVSVISSRRDSLRRLPTRVTALPFRKQKPTFASFPLCEVSQRALALIEEAERSDSALKPRVPSKLPFVSVPVVIGNTSDWLGERASATANHRWCVYVRGVNNAPLGDMIDHVTFVLHPSFPKPQQTIFKEPFVLTEHGWGEFDVAIYIKFKHIELPLTAAEQMASSVSSPTGQSSSTSTNRGVYVKLVHPLKFSHRNPLLLAAESRVNQEVAAAMTQPPAVLFGSTGSGAPSPVIPAGTSFQSVQFLLTNPTLTMALPPLPTTPAAVVHKLHCVPPNGNAYYGVPNYTPFALVEHTVVSESRDELTVFHPSSEFLERVASYLATSATFDGNAQSDTSELRTSLAPHMFSKVLKYSPLLGYHSTTNQESPFNEWDLYAHQALQDKRLLTAVEADLMGLMKRYIYPQAGDEMRNSVLHQLKSFAV